VGLTQALTKGRSEGDRAVVWVGFGLALTAAMLAVCIVITPQSLRVDDGVSYLGVHADTIIPYAIAFLGAAYCVWRASELTGDLDHGWVLSRFMRVMAFQLVGLLLTPYTRNDAAHVFFGSTLFLAQLGLAGMAITWLGGSERQVVVLTGVMILSGFAAAYYLPQSRGFELQTQVIFQMSFWALMIRLLRGLRGQSGRCVALPDLPLELDQG